MSGNEVEITFDFEPPLDHDASDWTELEAMVNGIARSMIVQCTQMINPETIIQTFLVHGHPIWDYFMNFANLRSYVDGDGAEVTLTLK